MIECNKCSRRKCDRLRLHRAKKRVLSTDELQSHCPYHQPVPRVTEQLLILALGTNPQGVQDVLSQFDFRIIDLKSYPFQRAVSNKPERKKGNRKHGHRPNRKRTHRGETKTGVPQL